MARRKPEDLSIIIDRKAGEIIRLVASVCLCVCVCVCLSVCPSSPVYHCQSKVLVWACNNSSDSAMMSPLKWTRTHGSGLDSRVLGPTSPNLQHYLIPH